MHWNVNSRVGKGSVRDRTKALQEGTSSHAPETTVQRTGTFIRETYHLYGLQRIPFCSGMRSQLDHDKYTSLEVQPTERKAN